MKRQDLMDYDITLALYTMCHCVEGMFDEISEDDLTSPSLRDGYRAVRSSISSLSESLEQYRDTKMGTFLESCEC